MFEIPDYATCAVSSIGDLPDCHRSVTRVVTILEVDGEAIDLRSTVACTRHVEIVEAHLAEQSELHPITVTKSEFPAFMVSMIRYPA